MLALAQSTRPFVASTAKSSAAPARRVMVVKAVAQKPK